MDLAVASVCSLGLGALAAMMMMQTHAYGSFVSNQRQNTIHSKDAIHASEVFAPRHEHDDDGRRPVSVVDVDASGRRTDVSDVDASGRRTDVSDASPLPPVDAGSLRLTLIDSLAPGGGDASMSEEETGRDGNHLHRQSDVFLRHDRRRPRSSFDAWDLARLWAPRRDEVGVDVGFGPWHVPTGILGSFVEPAWIRLSSGTRLACSRALCFGPRSVHVWDALSTVQTRVLDGGGTEVVCIFETLPLKFVNISDGVQVRVVDDAEAGHLATRDHVVREFSPLKDHFRRIIHAEGAACALETPGSDVAVMLVVVDLIRAAAECWIVHVSLLTRRILGLGSDHVGHQDRLANMDAWQRLERVPRDLQDALDFATDAAVARMEASSPPVDTTPLKRIKRETDAKLLTVRNAVADLAGHLASHADAKAALTGEDQARSLKRLTFVASIFLPISLAAALLSMNRRATNLGMLWYDFLSLSLLLVTAVSVVYQMMRAGDYLGATWDASIASTVDDASRVPAARDGVPLANLIRHQWTLAIKQLRGLSASNFVFLFYAIILPLPVTVSMVVGMFGSIDRGWSSLIYGLVGLGLAVILIATVLFVRWCLRVRSGGRG